MEEIINGDIRRFATINTTHYNNDGAYSVIVSDYDGLKDLGWDYEEEYPRYGSNIAVMDVSRMEVGDIVLAEEEGAYLMRLA